jgi:hypothetical protein
MKEKQYTPAIIVAYQRDEDGDYWLVFDDQGIYVKSNVCDISHLNHMLRHVNKIDPKHDLDTWLSIMNKINKHPEVQGDLRMVKLELASS